MPSLAAQMLRHFAVLLDSALAEPDRPLSHLQLFAADDAEWVRTVSTGEQFETPATTLTALVDRAGRAHP